MTVYVGLDIGGTKLAVAASPGGGQGGARTVAPTPEGLEEGLDRLDAMIAEVSAGEALAGLGVAIGAPLDRAAGTVSPLHQPAWRDVPLKARLEARYGCPCYMDVDTNVAAVGEYRLAGETPYRLLYLTLSTGMGGGLLVDGRPVRGAGDAHPEPSHQAVPFVCAHPERVTCECGAPDCLEGLVSGNGIRRVYGVAPEALDEASWAEVAHNLGLGLRNLAVLLVPEVIVFGGGVALGRGERLLGPAREVMASRLKLVPVPEVRLSRLGADTALCGALVIAEEGMP